MQFENKLPKVMGDSNQLLQVCLQLIANCLHIMNEQGGKVLILSTEQQAGISVLQITTDRATSSSLATISASADDSGDDLALSACRGILQEHRGNISRESAENGETVLRVELPAMDSPEPRTKNSTVPVLWQSQPSV
jgi:nitrogen-specific signal transduction histidine kinase